MMPNVSAQPDTTQQPAPIEGKLIWPLEHPVLDSSTLVNQAVTQLVGPPNEAPQYVALTLGHVTHPMFAGNPEQQFQAAQELSAKNGGILPVVITPVARVMMTIEQTIALQQALTETVMKWNAAHGVGDDHE